MCKITLMFVRGLLPFHFPRFVYHVALRSHTNPSALFSLHTLCEGVNGPFYQLQPLISLSRGAKMGKKWKETTHSCTAVVICSTLLRLTLYSGLLLGAIWPRHVHTIRGGGGEGKGMKWGRISRVTG